MVSCSSLFNDYLPILSDTLSKIPRAEIEKADCSGPIALKGRLECLKRTFAFSFVTFGVPSIVQLAVPDKFACLAPWAVPTGVMSAMFIKDPKSLRWKSRSIKFLDHGLAAAVMPVVLIAKTAQFLAGTIIHPSIAAENAWE